MKLINVAQSNNGNCFVPTEMHGRDFFKILPYILGNNRIV